MNISPMHETTPCDTPLSAASATRHRAKHTSPTSLCRCSSSSSPSTNSGSNSATSILSLTISSDAVETFDGSFFEDDSPPSSPYLVELQEGTVVAMVGSGMQPLHAKLVALQRCINDLSLRLRPLRARVRRFGQQEDVERVYTTSTRHAKQDSYRYQYSQRKKSTSKSKSRANRRKTNRATIKSGSCRTSRSYSSTISSGSSSRKKHKSKRTSRAASSYSATPSHRSSVESNSDCATGQNKDKHSNARNYAYPQDEDSATPQTITTHSCYRDEAEDDRYHKMGTGNRSNNLYSNTYSDHGTRNNYYSTYNDTSCNNDYYISNSYNICTSMSSISPNDKQNEGVHPDSCQDPLYTHAQTNRSVASVNEASESTAQIRSDSTNKSKCRNKNKRKITSTFSKAATSKTQAITSTTTAAASSLSLSRAAKPRATEMTPLSVCELSAMRRRCGQLARLYRRRGTLLRRVDLLLRQHARQQGKWESNEERVACYRCQRPFSALTRRHHCRRCGRLCCAECSCYFGKKQDTTCYAHARMRSGVRDEVQETGSKTACYDNSKSTSTSTRPSTNEANSNGIEMSHGRENKRRDKNNQREKKTSSTRDSPYRNELEANGQPIESQEDFAHVEDEDTLCDRGSTFRVGSRSRSTKHRGSEKRSEERKHCNKRSHSQKKKKKSNNKHKKQSHYEDTNSSDSSDTSSRIINSRKTNSECKPCELLNTPATAPSRRRGVVRTEYAMRMAAQDSVRNDPERYYDDYTYPVSVLPIHHRNSSSSNRQKNCTRSQRNFYDNNLGSQKRQQNYANAQELHVLRHSSEVAASAPSSCGIAQPPDWVRLCAVCYQECLRARKTDVLKRMKSANRCILDDGFYYFYVLTADELHCAHTLLNKPNSLKKQVELQSLMLLERSVDYLAGVQRSGTRMLARAAQQTPSVLLSTLGSLSLSTAQFARRATGEYVSFYMAKHRHPPLATQHCSTSALYCPYGHDLPPRQSSIASSSSSYSSLPECEPANFSRGSFCSNSSSSSLDDSSRNRSRDADEDAESIINSSVD